MLYTDRWDSLDVQRFYDWGVRARLNLIPTARKVLHDLAILPPHEADGPAIRARLEAILQEAELWGDQSWGIQPHPGSSPEPLPPDVTLDNAGIVEWASRINDLWEAVNRLGTYCHFRLKGERRREESHTLSSSFPAIPAAEYAQLKVKNVLVNDLEILLGRTALSSYPVRMEIDPTNECNLRCRACRHGITKDFHHIELRREYVGIISEALPFVDYIYPVGTGEPTMSSTLPMLISQAARHHVKVDMLTNGTLLAQADLPWEAFYRLGVSMDGASEETMRSLRPVAPLATVLAAVRLMRQKAPQAELFAKVTVSRVNYDEIPAIVEKLAEAGIDEVIVHSLSVLNPIHEGIQGRTVDRQHIQDCVAQAQAVAERLGVTFRNTLNFDCVARSEDDARSKETMLQVLKDTPLPVLKIHELSELKAALERWDFTYFPKGLEEHKARVTADRAASVRAVPPPLRVETIDPVLSSLLEQARKLTAGSVRVPYCFMPWKMPIVDSDGRARACCQLPGHLGDLDQGKSFQDLWSGPGYAALREAMFDTSKLPDTCASCQELDRSIYSEQTIALADYLMLPVRQAPNHPAPMDVAGLLKREARRGAWEALGPVQVRRSGVFELAPSAQILMRFPNPRTASGVYYQGKFQFQGGPVLVGVKPLWGTDLWSLMIDPGYTALLGDWVGLPMPPLPLDFGDCVEDECAVFLWALSTNQQPGIVEIAEFSGVATVSAPVRQNGWQRRHFWSGVTAAPSVKPSF
ncbi:MAG: SPASM domain-containing protein [Bryobacterales bacterium]|nr:SPASM domain-containing protein [Bryobacterales bacterium]